jgi:hypothetical protein
MSLHWHGVPTSRSIAQDPADVMQTVTALRVVVRVFGAVVLCVVLFGVVWLFVAAVPLVDTRFAPGSLRDLMSPADVLAGPPAVVNWPLPPPTTPPPGNALPPPAAPPGLNDVCVAAIDGPPARASPVDGLGRLRARCGCLGAAGAVPADLDASNLARMARVAVLVETGAVDRTRCG